MTDDVALLGEQQDLVPWLSCADLFLLPSAQESFGLAALEAMACEVPVVASNVGGLPEIIEDGVTGFVCAPEAVDLMAERGVALLTDASLRRSIAAAAVRLVQARYCTDSVVPFSRRSTSKCSGGRSPPRNPVSLPPIDTRPFFRPVTRSIVALLRSLTSAGWTRPTVAGNWQVRHVAAHLLDTALRTLSAGRDGASMPRPDRTIASERDLAAFINELNASWIHATDRLSPNVLTICTTARAASSRTTSKACRSKDGREFRVVGRRDESETWFHVARELTEIWHHGAQIRDAVDAGPFEDPRWLQVVLEVAVRGLPHAYRGIAASPGRTIELDVTGPSGGRWLLVRRETGWESSGGRHAEPDGHGNHERRDGVAAALQRAVAGRGRADGSPRRRHRARPSLPSRQLSVI